jgi:hypothetical protein
MIRYDLSCDRDHGFEAWFRNSGDYDRQLLEGDLLCPICGSEAVTKRLMAPNIGRGRSASAPRMRDQAPVAIPVTADPASAALDERFKVLSGDPRVREAIEQIRKIKQHVVENAENVGDRFPEEARKIHYQEVEKRSIYGEASAEEVDALIEEGVEVHPMPILPEDQN